MSFVFYAQKLLMKCHFCLWKYYHASNEMSIWKENKNLKSNKYKEKANFLGELIAEKRKACHFSQNVLASKMQLMGINIGKNDISKIEAGKRLIRDYELLAIKDILNLELNNLHL